MFYRAWVPTVSGRLSFKIIGESKYPNRAEYANVSTETHQYILVSQSRNLSDVLFGSIIGPLFGISGKFRFFYCARMRRADIAFDAPLVGKIFIVRQFKRSSPVGFSEALDEIRRIYIADPQNRARELYCQTTSVLEQHCDLSASALLHRDGTFAISNLRWHNEEVRANSMAQAESEGVEDLDHSIADQAYFFVRDICHQHQHHGADADTIITTQKDQSRDLSWATHIVYGLYLYIINSKRTGDSLEQVRVLGVLAYVKAFKNVLKQRELSKNMKPPPLPTFDDQSLSESINATRNYIELLQTRRRQSLDFSRNITFAVATALFALITFISGFSDGKAIVDPRVISTADFLKSHAYLGGVPLAVMLLWAASSPVVARRYDFKRDVLRLAITNRRWFVLATLILAAILAFCAWMLWSSLH